MTAQQNSAVRFVLFAASVSAIGGFLFGYDTAVINGANTYLTTHFALNAAQSGTASASAILGCIPGALVAGGLSDRFGRKRLLFICAILYAISGIFSACPRAFDEFLIARFIGGLGIGASSMICPVYIAEIAPEKLRGRLGTLFQLGIVIGIFLSLFVNRVIQGLGNEVWNVEMGWRWMMGSGAIPAFVFLGLLFAVPESPRWLAQQGNEAAALAVLEKVSGKDSANHELGRIRGSMGQEKGHWTELFTGWLRKPLVLAVLLMAFSQFCGINAIMYYSTNIFAEAGGGKDVAFTASVWVGLINLLFTFVAIAFVDKWGRRPLLLIGTAVQTVSLALVGWALATNQHGIILLACVIAFIAAFAMAMGPIGWLFCSEVFPNRVRGLAVSITSFAVWVSCYIVAQTFPMLNDSKVVGPAKTFWIYAAVSLASFLFVLALIPETKNRTLEEIEKIWNPAALATANAEPS